MGLSWSPLFPAGRRQLPQTPRPKPLKAAIPAANLGELAQRVRAEYYEMPGLSLTREQARCLWALESTVCDTLLNHLLEIGFLRETAQGTFVRRNAG